MSPLSKPARRLLLFALLGGVLCLFLLCAALLALTGTQPGRAYLARLAGDLSSSPEMRVELQGLESVKPWDFRLRAFSLADAGGVWLQGESLALNLSLADLLRGAFTVRSMVLERLVFLRPPEAGEAQEPESFTMPAIPPIRIDELRVETLLLHFGDPPQERVFILDASCLPEPEAFALSLHLREREGRDREPDSLAVSARWHTTRDELDLQAALHEGAGGMLGGLLGVPGDMPMSGRLHGTGGLTRWQGELDLKAGPHVLLRGDLTVSNHEALKLTLTGAAEDSAGLLPVEVADYTGRSADFDIAVSLLGELYRLEALRLETPNLRLDAGGELRGETLEATAELHVRDPELLAKASQGSLSGTPHLRLTLHGTPERAVLDVEAEPGALALEQLASDPARMLLRLELPTPLRGLHSLEAGGEVLLSGLRPSTAYTLPPEARIAFKAGFERSQGGAGRIRVQTLDVDNGENSLRATAEIDLEPLAIQATLEADIPHAGAIFSFQAAEGAVLDAALQFRATAKGDMKRGITATVSGSVERLQGLQPELAAFIGQNLDLELKVDVSETHVTLHKALLTAATVLEASGTYGLEDQGIEAALWLTPPTHLDLPEGLRDQGLHVQGLKPLTAKLAGTLARLDIEADAGAASLQLGERVFRNVSLRVTGSQAGVPLEGERGAVESSPFSLSLDSTELSLAAMGRYVLEPETLALAPLRVTLPGTELDGNLRIHFSGPPLEGRLGLRAQRLDWLGTLAGLDLSGGAELHVELAPRGERQTATLRGEARSLHLAGVGVALLDIDAHGDDLLAPDAQLKLTARDVRTDGITVESLELKAALRQQEMRFEATAGGRVDKPFTLAIGGEGSLAGPAPRVRLDSLRGDYASLPFRLRGPMRLEGQGRGYRLDNLELELDTAILTASGLWEPDRTDLQARLAGLRLETLQRLDLDGGLAPSGGLDLDLRLQGTPAAPRLSANLLGKELQLAGPAAREQGLDLPPLALRAEVELTQDSCRATAELTLSAVSTVSTVSGREETPLAKAQAGLPARFSLQPFLFEMREDAPLTAQASGGLDLLLLQDILGFSDQVLKGRAAFDLKATGALNAPQLAGEVTIAQGRYENLRTGTLLADIGLEMRATGSRIEIVRLQATDGGKGRLSGSGGIDLQELRYDAAIDMREFTPVHMNIFTCQVKGGLEFSGTPEQGALSGLVTIDRGAITLPRSLPPGIDSVEVRQKGLGVEEPPPPHEKAKPMDVRLDVQVEIPGRFTVRGHGLDSEWSGGMHVTGTAAAPEISGGLEVRRGSLDFLDKNFTIEQGELRFGGGTPPSPLLEVVTSARAANLVAKVTVSGPVNDLSFRLSSDPVVPQSEILADVLFGRSLDRITPLQAIRLARALDQLAGNTGGASMDVLGSMKKALDVDSLSAGEGETGGTTLQAGKYIGDKIYVQGQKGLNPKDDSMSVEVEILPQLELESEIGADSQGGIGLNWRLDY